MNLDNIKKVDIFVKHKDLNNLKILHLSDLHINTKLEIKKISKLIKICKNLEYDFAVITGDIIDCKCHKIEEKLNLLNELSKIKDTYYISGNHDIFYGLQDLKKSLNKLYFMDNRLKKLSFKGKDINLIGLADRFSGFFGVYRDEKKINLLLQDSSPSIFISHQPKDYKFAINNNTELFLCGHTHGGQIYPFGYIVRMFQPFLKGLFYKNQTAIYVNSGIGTWGVDFRYKAPSEISILNLISSS